MIKLDAKWGQIRGDTIYFTGEPLPSYVVEELVRLVEPSVNKIGYLCFSTIRRYRSSASLPSGMTTSASGAYVMSGIKASVRDLQYNSCCRSISCATLKVSIEKIRELAKWAASLCTEFQKKRKERESQLEAFHAWTEKIGKAQNWNTRNLSLQECGDGKNLRFAVKLPIKQEQLENFTRIIERLIGEGFVDIDY